VTSTSDDISVGVEYGAHLSERERKLIDAGVVTDELEALWYATGGSNMVAAFSAERDSPGCARRLVVGALAEWGCDATLVQDAAVVVSELATNAVVHAGSPFSISAELEDGLLRVAVEDACPLSVAMRGGGLEDPQPTHGLGLIEALCARWGVEGSPRGKVVWAELDAGAYTRQAVR
jgi:anti-sigma regulatory factor (Ser/Thr protein kinase)